LEGLVGVVFQGARGGGGGGAKGTEASPWHGQSWEKR